MFFLHEILFQTIKVYFIPLINLLNILMLNIKWNIIFSVFSYKYVQWNKVFIEIRNQQEKDIKYLQMNQKTNLQ